MLRIRNIAFKTAQYTLRFKQIELLETKNILLHSAEFWLVQYRFVAKGMSCLISLMSDNMSTKRKPSVLSIKDKQIINNLEPEEQHSAESMAQSRQWAPDYGTDVRWTDFSHRNRTSQWKWK